MQINDTDKGVSKTRTSYGAWLSHQWRDNVIASIEERIHDTVGVPREFGEGIYVLRYEANQKYDPHTDNCARRVGFDYAMTWLGFVWINWSTPL